MFVNAVVLLAPLLLFSFAVLWTNIQAQGASASLRTFHVFFPSIVLNNCHWTFIGCQHFSSCPYACSWDNCCTQIGCNNCNLTLKFSCQIEIISTGSVGTFSWCTAEVNDILTPTLINITFESYSECILVAPMGTICAVALMT